MDESKQILLEEWKDIRESLRYFGNKRFNQLTVFIAINGFMFDAFFKQPNRLPLQIVGVVIGLLFLVMEYSSVKYWSAFAARGEAIEKEIGNLQLMTKHRPQEKWMSATKATYIVYWGIILLWLIASSLANTTSPKDVTDIVARALNDAPSFATDKQTTWSLSSLSWEDSSRTYRLALRAATSSQTMVMTVDAITGRVIKVEKPAP